MESTRTAVKNFIIKQLPPGFDASTLTDDVELRDSRILDSLLTVELAMFLEDRFRIALAVSDLEGGNLVSINSIARLVETKIAHRDARTGE